MSAVSGVMIKNSIGLCLTYIDSLQGSGQPLLTANCDTSDETQTNWTVTNLASSGYYSPYQFCINGTTLCAGLQFAPRIGMPKNEIASVNLKLVANDPTDDGQQWFALDTQTLPNHFVNGWSGGCIQAFQIRPIASTRRCTNVATQEWKIIN